MKRVIRIILVCGLLWAGVASAADLDKANALFDKKQYTQALKIYLKPEWQNNPMVQTRIGWLYGYAAELKDDKKSFEWFMKSAMQGYDEGQFNVAVAYRLGKGTDQDYSKALQWYQKAADQGLTIAYTDMGNMYSEGRGVKKDPKKAMALYENAAAGGSTIAQCNLGYMFTGKKDYSKARDVLQQCLSANPNNDCCLSRMADLYRKGWGVPQDHTKANEYQARAAALGSGIAMFSLGTAYDYGFGVEKDAATALQWYEKGAATGEARSLYRLYEIHEYGRLGQPIDKVKAKAWLTRAEPAMKEQNVTRNAMKDQLRLMMEN